MTPTPFPTPRALLDDLYAAATAAVAPGVALAQRLDRLSLDSDRRIHVLALGKAAAPMALAALDRLQRDGQEPAGGLVVGPAPGRTPHPQLTCVRGDHPEPGSGSSKAASALADAASRVRRDDEVWVLLSGGTTSLIGAPEPGIAPQELSTLYRLLLGSGLDITAMNQVRKRFSRWGAGKLARALAPARVRLYIVSDVIGDDLASIGSGPCVPDPTKAADVRGLLERSRLWNQIPESFRALITSTQAGRMPETPKPGDPVFARVTTEIVASNKLALEAAAMRAAELGLNPTVIEPPIAGEASEVGRQLAGKLRECAGATCLIWGGETTVTLGAQSTGLGGRCQELALAAAEVLADTKTRAALLAAGTDGRDGPTDAAGAIVDRETWPAIVAAGRDPARDLAAHDAYHALDAVGALLRPGLTGTNVMDIVVGLCGEERT